MSEDEVEKFEITDYDLENEFSMFRRRRNLTKNQQIYGIWADESDEDKQGSSKTTRASKDYTAPIGFVAGGVQQAGKKKEKKDESNGESDKSDDEDDGEYKKEFMKNSSSDSDSDGPAMRAGFGKPTKSTVTEITGDIAGLRKQRVPLNPSLINKGVGNWEKHTKGIGAKLLLQMGYQPGKGLGKDLQGISAPVEAHMRKGRGAIGAYGPEKAAKIADAKMTKSNQDDNDSGNENQKWKKGDNKHQEKKKLRYYYRSVDDVIEKGKRPGAFRSSSAISELSKVKVIDMTGPQQRVLSGYHALSGPKAPPGVELYEDVIHKQCANFALPEIQHNLDLLVDMCEEEIIICDRSTRHCQDRLVALNQEETQLKNVLQKEEEYIDTMESVLETVTKLLDQSQGLSLGQVAQTFRDLQKNHFEEYSLYELGELAPGLVSPLITSALASWSPLTSPKQYMDIFVQWKDILDKPKYRGVLESNNTNIQPYDSLVWNTWVPVIRGIVTTWNARDCDPLIDLLDTWAPLLPPWILDNIIDQLVLPRLTAEVSIWNPLTDTTPIHVWIHPWIPLLGARIHTVVFPLIQEKLGTALSNWHPSDRSAKLMLKPWQAALPEGIFAAFLHKHIVPKLHICMQSFILNPHQQHLEAWNWVMDWTDLISVVTMIHILDKCFFPRWLQTLALWLNHNPDYAQVTEWYSGWKRMLSEQLLAQPTIKDHFHKALELMNRAVTSGQQPGALESVSYLTNMENLPPPPPPPRIEAIAETIRTTSLIPTGFKDLIAKRCEERGILFVPIPNRFHEAKQVYRIGGNTQCYIDRNVVFVNQNGSVWLPTSLSRLLDMAS